MQTGRTSPAIILLATAICLLRLTASSGCYAQEAPPTDDVPVVFFVSDDEYIVRFRFLTEDGSTRIERRSGKCVQKITVPKASITVFRIPDFEVLAEGVGAFNVDATVDCQSGFYTFERTIATSAGLLFAPQTGERLRFNLRAVVIDGMLKTFNLSLNPL